MLMFIGDNLPYSYGWYNNLDHLTQGSIKGAQGNMKGVYGSIMGTVPEYVMVINGQLGLMIKLV